MIGMLSTQMEAVLVVMATSAAYFFSKLYHARMLVIEKQKQGLVCHAIIKCSYGY